MSKNHNFADFNIIVKLLVLGVSQVYIFDKQLLHIIFILSSSSYFFLSALLKTCAWCVTDSGSVSSSYINPVWISKHKYKSVWELKAPTLPLKMWKNILKHSFVDVEHWY